MSVIVKLKKPTLLTLMHWWNREVNCKKGNGDKTEDVERRSTWCPPPPTHTPYVAVRIRLWWLPLFCGSAFVLKTLSVYTVFTYTWLPTFNDALVDVALMGAFFSNLRQGDGMCTFTYFNFRCCMPVILTTRWKIDPCLTWMNQTVRKFYLWILHYCI